MTCAPIKGDQVLLCPYENLKSLDWVVEKRHPREYRKVPKFSDTRKLCCNLPKIKTKRQNLLIFQLKDAKGIANSEDPDQTASL